MAQARRELPLHGNRQLFCAFCAAPPNSPCAVRGVSSRDSGCLPAGVLIPVASTPSKVQLLPSRLPYRGSNRLKGDGIETAFVDRQERIAVGGGSGEIDIHPQWKSLSRSRAGIRGAIQTLRLQRGLRPPAGSRTVRFGDARSTEPSYGAQGQIEAATTRDIET